MSDFQKEKEYWNDVDVNSFQITYKQYKRFCEYLLYKQLVCLPSFYWRWFDTSKMAFLHFKRCMISIASCLYLFQSAFENRNYFALASIKCWKKSIKLTLVGQHDNRFPWKYFALLIVCVPDIWYTSVSCTQCYKHQNISHSQFSNFGFLLKTLPASLLHSLRDVW